jgi:hypothetical protein
MAVRREPKAREMPRFPKREPAPIPACEACGAFQPDCLTPDGEGALAMCWPCAHAHVDHGCELGKCAVHECDCLPEAIYPEKVLASRRERATNAKPS